MVCGVIAFVAGGARWVGTVVAEPTPSVVNVGDVVTVTPEPGWEVVSTAEEPGTSQALLQRGTAGLVVSAVDAVDGSVQDLARRYVDDALQGRFAQLTIGGTESEVAERLSFGYVGITLDGVAIQGVVTVELGASGAGGVFDAFAPTGNLGAAVGDLREMVATAEVA